MEEYISLNDIGSISDSNESNRNYYIIHNPILRLESGTTALRAVFDTSARRSSRISFNSILLKGETF